MSDRASSFREGKVRLMFIVSFHMNKSFPVCLTLYPTPRLFMLDYCRRCFEVIVKLTVH